MCIKVIRKVGDALTGGVGAVVGGTLDVTDFVFEEILQPIGDGAADVLKYTIDNPIEAIAKGIAIASGQWWAVPLVDGAIALDSGADFDDVLKTIAVSTIATTVGASAGSWATTATGKALGSTSWIATATAQAVGAGTKRATTALIYGQDPLKAFASGGISSLVGASLGKLDDMAQEKFGTAFEKLPDGVQDAVFGGMSSELSELVETGGLTDSTVGALVSKYTSVGNIIGDAVKTIGKDWDEATVSLITSAVTTSMSTALLGRPDLAGEAFFGELNNAGTAALNAVIAKPINELTDKLTGVWGDVQAAAGPLNEAITNAQTAGENYTSTLQYINAQNIKLDQLYDAAQDGGYNKEKAYSDFLADWQAEYPGVKNTLDGYRADYDEWFPQIEGLQAAYDESTT